MSFSPQYGNNKSGLFQNNADHNKDTTSTLKSTKVSGETPLSASQKSFSFLSAKKDSPTARPTPSFKSPTSPFARQSTHPTTAPSFRKEFNASNEEFTLLRDFIYKQCGIFISDSRKYLIENRLSNRIKELNLKSYGEYYKYLRFDLHKEEELNKLFVMVTTNETSFFRNPPQLQIFQNTVLTQILDACRKTNYKKLRIWSAGCSTGEEPYTLAMILNEVLKNEIRSWDIKITANDLSPQVLVAARNGIYNEYALRTTPKDLIPKYFTKDGNVFKVNQDLKRLVSFSQINLSDRTQIKNVERSHIVFCRNVIIYFDDDMKRKVINSFYDNLLPNGVLFIGHSESLHNICRSFHLEHYTGTVVYRKRVE